MRICIASVRDGSGELRLGENLLADFRAVSTMDSEEWEQTWGEVIWQCREALSHFLDLGFKQGAIAGAGWALEELYKSRQW